MNKGVVMALFTDAERKCAHALVALGYCNPFLPERITYEREILGKAFVGAEDVWYKDVQDEESRPNLELLTQRAKSLADRGRSRMMAGQASGDEEISLYADTVLYYFFNTFSESFHPIRRRRRTGEHITNGDCRLSSTASGKILLRT
jgi:hypothetical protein